VAQAGTYQVSASNNCGTVSVATTITVKPLPLLNVSPSDTLICAGASVQLTASGASHYEWFPGSSLYSSSGASVTAVPTVTTTYTVTGNTPYGCTASKDIRVNVSPVITPFITITQGSCSADSVLFSTNTNSGRGATIEWYVNNTFSGTGTSYLLKRPANGKQVYAKVITASPCAVMPSATSAAVTANCLATAVPVVAGMEAMEVGPNPSDGSIMVWVKLNSVHRVSFTIKDQLGRQLYFSPAVVMSGEVSKYIDLRRAGQGMYYLEVTIENTKVIKKLVIKR
jgi:hypothetical protein